jgi:hypothetical protein
MYVRLASAFCHQDEIWNHGDRNTVRCAVADWRPYTRLT